MYQSQQIRSFNSVLPSHQLDCHLEWENSELYLQQSRLGPSLDRLNLKKSPAECGQLAGLSSSTSNNHFCDVHIAPSNVWSVNTTCHSEYITQVGHLAVILSYYIWGLPIKPLKKYRLHIQLNASYQQPIMHRILTLWLICTKDRVCNVKIRKKKQFRKGIEISQLKHPILLIIVIQFVAMTQHLHEGYELICLLKCMSTKWAKLSLRTQF